MANNRIFYATQQVDIKGNVGGSYGFGTAVRGLQSVAMTTNFSLSQVFELGQISIYENIEGTPNVEMTLSKILDGYPLIGHLASYDASLPTLVARTATKCDTRLGIYSDALSSATGTAPYIVGCSGMFINSWGFNFSLEDNSTEEVTLVGNDKLWKGDSRIANPSDQVRANALTQTGQFNDADAPKGPGQHVTRRENIIFGTGAAATPLRYTKLPIEIPGINALGQNIADADNVHTAHIGNITVRADIRREDIFELGRKTQYYRSVTFPIEVTSEIEMIAISGDMISATEAGILSTSSAQCSVGGNLSSNTIQVATCEGTIVYLGAKNKLASVNYSGGDAGGGNVRVRYSYSTFNTMTVLHSGDPNPSGAAAVGNWWGNMATYLTGG